MSVRQTSREAYHALENIGAKQAAALRALKTWGPLCNAALADVLGWPVNTVTPRVHELRNLGLVEDAGRAVYPPTNRMSIHWRAVEQSPILTEKVGKS